MLDAKFKPKLKFIKKIELLPQNIAVLLKNITELRLGPGII